LAAGFAARLLSPRWGVPAACFPGTCCHAASSFAAQPHAVLAVPLPFLWPPRRQRHAPPPPAFYENAPLRAVSASGRLRASARQVPETRSLFVSASPPESRNA